MKSLADCYAEMAKLLGPHVEPFASVALVNQYRQYWRPEKVRVILLAESHVYTSDSDRVYKLVSFAELPGYPEHYAKFVYCLAYGEETLTEGNQHPAPDGTPQFWKVLYSCVKPVETNEAFGPVLKSKTNTSQRIKNKIEILKEMRKRGIWLIDASIMALYDRGRKPAPSLLLKAIRTSWLGCVRELVLDTGPEHIIVIGKSVAKKVEPELSEIMGRRVTIIDQPNARLSAEQHLVNYKKYYEICAV